MTAAEFLTEWMIRSSILIASGALLLWLLRVKDSSIRAVAWTVVLCGSFLLPALTFAFPKTLLPAIRRTAAGVVIRPAEVQVAVPGPAPAHVPSLRQIGPLPKNALSARPEPAAPRRADRRLEWAGFEREPFDGVRLDWVRAALMLYAAVCGVMLLRLCFGFWAGLRLLRGSRAAGLVRGEIEIRESGRIGAPATLGTVRPAIVLPLDWREWESARLEAVLAHERSHVQRRDPLAQLLSGIHRALLWASPLSWFLHRRIVQTAEEASDDAAVAAIHDRVSYAETLLDFMRRGVWNSGFTGVSMARYGSPVKRIRRILDSTAHSRGVTGRGVAAIVALASPLVYAIATAQVRPQFDAADVHFSAASTGGARGGAQGGTMRAGIYQIQTATMVDLIKAAYDIDADKVLGGPSWLELDRYDVFAKGPDPASTDMARLMLQSLLADRFKLVLHKDSRPLPGFALTVGKGATPKLKRAGGSGSTGCRMTPQYTEAELGARRQALTLAGENRVIIQNYSYACQNMTMAAFAEGIRSMVGVQQYFDAGNSPILPLGSGVAVVDQTGLSGEWDFSFKYSQKPPPSAAILGIDGENITIFDAIEKQLGLKLEAARIPTPVIIVDSVNRKPTDNPPEVKAILPPAPPAEFEAADLRLSAPSAPEVRSRGPEPGGRFEVRNFPLSFLIMIGWGLPTNGALKGAPPWLSSARVDLTARLPATAATHEITGAADIDEFAPALKTLLTQRFKVSIHTEQQPVPGYALVAAKVKALKADPSERTKCKEGPGADGKDPRIGHPVLSRLVTCQNMTMPEYAEQLSRLLGGVVRTPVVDSTGIDGAYDLTLSFTDNGLATALANQPGAADPGGEVTLFEALEKQLGLKLEKRNIPMPVVVLDHIDEKPADN